jgi:hypothetical protein
MPKFNAASLNDLLATPLMLPVSVAGALAALFVVLLFLVLRRAGPPGISRVLVGIAGLGFVTLAVLAVLDRMETGERSAERRAILARNAELTAQVLAPGSMLACLDGAAGEVIENSCEKAVFANPETTAGAVAYVGARLTLLAEASEFGESDPQLLKSFSAARRAIELDRYGIAAHVLSVRDGCTAERCPSFALLQYVDTLKANMKVHAFDSYVTRYAAAWNKSVPVAEKAPLAPAPVASAPEPGPSKNPVSSRYDFPSAASIPPVSIMNVEPPLAKEPATTASVPQAAEHPAPAVRLPVPPKRPQKQAPEPPPR